MIKDRKSLRESLTDFLGSLEVQLRAALSTGVGEDDYNRRAERSVDPEFEAWLQNDPIATGNPASRYRSQPPGYLTSNGRGSLEIGAADD
jgi:hypothetical protein